MLLCATWNSGLWWYNITHEVLPNWKEAVLAVEDQRLNQEHTELTVTQFCMCSLYVAQL